jgi:nitroreductase
MTRVRFRAWEHNGTSQVEVRSISASRSFRGEALSLAQSILSGELASAIPPGGHNLDEYEAWDKNGWSDALPFYLSTLDQQFADAAPDYRAAQLRVLETYNRSDSIPVESIPDCLTWTPLERSKPPAATRAEILRQRRTTLVPEPTRLPPSELGAILSEATVKLAAFRTSNIASDPRNALVNFGPSLDVYVVVYEIEGLAAGLYRYDMNAQKLGLLKRGEFRSTMRTVIVGQPATMTAVVSVLYVSDVCRHWWRYRHERALRGLWIDTAKVANELLWSLAARGIVPHMTPAINDAVANELLNLGSGLEHEVVYAISFGGPHEAAFDDRN